MPVDMGTGHKALIGVAVAIGNIMVYSHFVPPISDVRVAEPFDSDVENAERKALIYTGVLTSLVALLTRSKEVFIIGGVAIIAEDFATKHANAVNPDTGKMTSATPPALDVSNVESFPMTDYAGSDQ
jgi:hypothetical protein